MDLRLKILLGQVYFFSSARLHLLPYRYSASLTANHSKRITFGSYEEMRSILINNSVNYLNILKSISLSVVYFIFGVIVFYISYFGAKKEEP